MTDAASEQLLYTLDEAREILRVSERTLRNLMAAGRIRPVSIGARKLITRRELEAFVAGLERRRRGA